MQAVITQDRCWLRSEVRTEGEYRKQKVVGPRGKRCRQDQRVSRPRVWEEGTGGSHLECLELTFWTRFLY